MFDEFDWRVRGTTAATLEAGVIAYHDLLRSSGEVAGLAVRQIALQARSHLKTVDSGAGISDDDSKSLLRAGRVGLSILEINDYVSAAAV